MIRKANLQDLKSINSIGNLISSDFDLKNKLEERIKLDYVEILAFEDKDSIKGFVEIERHFETTDIINIAVSQEFQNNGIATSLLNYVIDNYNQKRIMLEVSVINTNAINFYKANGFNEINRRKKYYENKYDAIIMERKLV